MVSSSEAIVFQFPPFEDEMRQLPASLSCTDDATWIQSSSGVTWPDSGLRETNGSPVRVIQAGENVPAATFTLNGPADVLEVQLQVVVGPEMFPRTDLQEVDMHESWR